jgi:hypothetical protein
LSANSSSLAKGYSIPVSVDRRYADFIDARSSLIDPWHYDTMDSGIGGIIRCAP